MSRNMAFDLPTLNLSASVYRLSEPLIRNMRLQSFTNTGVICIAPHELPFTAFAFPSLSTWIIASITGFQSILLVFNGAPPAAVNTGNAAHNNRNKNNLLVIKLINYCFWHLGYKTNNNEPAIRLSKQKGPYLDASKYQE